MGILCVTVDLDEVDCYYAIHGRPMPEKTFKDVVYLKALPRILLFFEELRICGTLFVVGENLLRCYEAASMLRDATFRGWEIGNHTMNHRYDFTLLSNVERSNQLDLAAQAIHDEIGVRPLGFRAPGYTITSAVVEDLVSKGYTYDSSVFPCPAYYAAKAVAIAAKSYQGHASASILGDPNILRAPRTPYQIGSDGVWSRGTGLKEFPISVATPARIPLIGTALSMMGKIPASILAKQVAKLPFVNIELHGMDFVDPENDGVESIRDFQPDMRISLAKRKDIYFSFIETLLEKEMTAVPLIDASSRLFF